MSQGLFWNQTGVTLYFIQNFFFFKIRNKNRAISAFVRGSLLQQIQSVVPFVHLQVESPYALWYLALLRKTAILLTTKILSIFPSEIIFHESQSKYTHETQSQSRQNFQWSLALNFDLKLYDQQKENLPWHVSNGGCHCLLTWHFVLRIVSHGSASPVSGWAVLTQSCKTKYKVKKKYAGAAIRCTVGEGWGLCLEGRFLFRGVSVPVGAGWGGGGGL